MRALASQIYPPLREVRKFAQTIKRNDENEEVHVILKWPTPLTKMTAAINRMISNN